MPLVFKGDVARHRLDEGVLRAVLGVLRVFHKGIADAVNGLEVPQIKRFKISLHGSASLRNHNTNQEYKLSEGMSRKMKPSKIKIFKSAYYSID